MSPILISITSWLKISKLFHSSDLSFYIISLGCSKNLVDAEKLKGQLLSSSFLEAESSDRADIVIVLTCGFITPAKEEGIETIFDSVSLKENRASESSDFTPKLVAAGCLTKRYFTEMGKEIPEIDFLYGLLDADFLEKLAAEFDIALDSASGAPKQVPLAGSLPYRYIKIAEGCSNNCSYCAIPLIRGPLNNYDPEDIVRDAESAAADGAKELIIIAQDTAAYAKNGVALPELIRRVSAIEGPEWIRLLYCHPDHITDELIAELASNPKLVKYVDIPFQHVSGDIVRSMGRRGDYDSYLALIAKLRSSVPDIRIRSTFMVGYPGETDAHFDELMKFIRTARLDRVGAFLFSPEEGTRAAELPDQVDQDAASARYDVLMEAQKKISAEKMQAMIGRTVRVLVEERADGETYVGRSEYDAPEVDGIFYLTARTDAVNKMVYARVVDAVEYDLIGEQLENPPCHMEHS